MRGFLSVPSKRKKANRGDTNHNDLATGPNQNPLVVDIPLLFQPGDGSIPCIAYDLKHFGCIWIPSRYVENAPASLQVSAGNAAYICMDRQRGQCIARDGCKRLHVSPHFMDVVRRAPLAAPFSNCCLTHGDVPSRRPHFGGICHGIALEIVGDPGKPRFFVAPRLIAATAYWDNRSDLPAQYAIKVGDRRVCRLHQQNLCNRGPLCGNVHFCREMWLLRAPILCSHPEGETGLGYFVTQTFQQKLEVTCGSAAEFQTLLTMPNGMNSASLKESLMRLRGSWNT